jgi:hypothetical protein
MSLSLTIYYILTKCRKCLCAHVCIRSSIDTHTHTQKYCVTGWRSSALRGHLSICMDACAYLLARLVFRFFSRLHAYSLLIVAYTIHTHAHAQTADTETDASTPTHTHTHPHTRAHTRAHTHTHTHIYAYIRIFIVRT